MTSTDCGVFVERKKKRRKTFSPKVQLQSLSSIQIGSRTKISSAVCPEFHRNVPIHISAQQNEASPPQMPYPSLTLTHTPTLTLFICPISPSASDIRMKPVKYSTFPSSPSSRSVYFAPTPLGVSPQPPQVSMLVTLQVTALHVKATSP